MATLEEILGAVADQIRGVLDDVTDLEVQVAAGWLIAPANGVAVDVYPADPSDDPELAAFGETIGGEVLFVRARVSPADFDAGQSLLLSLMDDEHELSIAAALDEDPTLGGLASTVALRGRSGYREFPDANGEGRWLGALWSYVVVKARS